MLLYENINKNVPITFWLIVSNLQQKTWR